MPDSAQDIIPFEQTTDGPLAGLLSYPEDGFQISSEFEPDALLERGRYHPSGPWLVCASPSVVNSRSIKVRNYPVMTDPRCRDLHRTFARIGDDRDLFDRILKFSNRFGWLGDSEFSFELRPVRRSSLPQDLVVTGENLWGWRKRAFEVAALVAFWDLVLADDRSELSKYIFWEGSPRRVGIFFAYHRGRLTTDRSFFVNWRTPTYHSSDSTETEAVADEREPSGRYRFAAFPELIGPRFDILKAAEIFLYEQINERLWNNVSPQLHAERKAGEALMLVPHNLLAAIFLHFARDMAGRQPLSVPCANPHCSQVVVPRWGTRYCSPACRSQAYYYRRKAAGETRSQAEQS